MIKFKRLKSAIISSAVAISALAAPLTTAVTPSLTANAAGGDNYAKLLQYSLYFYDANMCDVVGGFHDAGDHVWFGQPEGYTAATLGWAYYEFKDAFDATGQTAHLKVITDRFAKFMRDATVLNGGSVSKVLIEKGEGGQDHSYWGAPELQGNRGRMLWTTDGAANITAEYAAALAANYINFGNPDDLTYAKALFNFAKQHQGSYSCEFYGNKETSDEIAWAACWLYLATKDNSYMGDIQNIGTAYWVHCWENVSLGAAILKGEITGDWSCTNALGDMSGDGYKFYDQWGSARHNATAQMCQLIAAKHGHGNAAWAKGQMEYLTGDRSFANGQSYCLVVGFKDNSSKNPHHRAASPDADASEQNDGIANKNLLIGALCGGPVDANGTYKDIRSDYKGNEVACDYNAGLVGAAAGLYSNYKSGSIETNITGVSKIYSGSGSSNNQTTPTTTTTTTTTNGGNNNNTTTTTTNGGNGSSSGDVVLEGSKLGATTEEGDDGAINNVAEFPHNGAKSLTMYLKVNSNDTEVSGGFGTWNGEWLQEEFSGVKVGSDKTVAIDYTIPSNAGTNIKAMVWWPHDDGVTIQKIVLHGGSGSSNNTTSKTTTTTTTSRTTTSTTTSTTTTTTTEAPKQDKPTLLGDSNCDGIVDLSDAVLIMQALANPNKYGKQGTAELHISEQGWINADVHQKGNGVSTNDALAIQMKLLGRISGFPIDVLN